MPVAMLDSQFDTLEEPDMDDEVVMELDVNARQDHLAEQACAHLSKPGSEFLDDLESLK